MANRHPDADDRTPSYASVATCETCEDDGGREDPDLGIGPDGGPRDDEGDDLPRLPPQVETPDLPPQIPPDLETPNLPPQIPVPDGGPGLPEPGPAVIPGMEVLQATLGQFMGTVNCPR